MNIQTNSKFISLYTSPQQALENLNFNAEICDKVNDAPGQLRVYVPIGQRNDDTSRLASYTQFPKKISKIVPPALLAKNGFTYTGFQDRVKCHGCGRGLQNFNTYGVFKRIIHLHKDGCDFINERHAHSSTISLTAKSRISTYNKDGAGMGCTTVKSDVDRPSTSTDYTHSTVCNTQNSTPDSIKFKFLEQPGTSRVQISEDTSSDSSSDSSENETRRPTRKQMRAHKKLMKRLDVKKEEDRFLSFSHMEYAQNKPSATEFAKSGMFYLGLFDVTECFSCGGQFAVWRRGDNVNAKHLSQYPNCKMALGIDESNVPLNSDHELPGNAVPTQGDSGCESLQQTLDSTNLFPCQNPFYSNLSNSEERLQTYTENWEEIFDEPSSLRFSSAGFFYLGSYDHVRCWYCNGGLKNFDSDTNPWFEHAKWFPTCEFLLQKKRFIVCA